MLCRATRSEVRTDRQQHGKLALGAECWAAKSISQAFPGAVVQFVVPYTADTTHTRKEKDP
jgi:hypothetical protein